MYAPIARSLFAALILVCVAGTGAHPALAQGADAPLFSSHDPLEFTLYADFDEIRGNRNDTIPHPARLVIAGQPEPGTELKLWVRGNFRRQRSNCTFPPLRLDFDKDDADLGVFAGQNRLKMVVRCRDNDTYEQYVLKEYLAYRLYGLLTDQCFRVRLVHVTYADTSGKRKPETHWAFIIEDDDDMAARFGGEVLDLPQIDPRAYNAEQSTLMSVFQYMVGNTDMSSMMLHNVLALKVGESYLAIPYDFDWTGLVSARYAVPDPKVGVQDVRTRVYRGVCRESVDYAAIYDRFIQIRPQIEPLIASIPFDKGTAERALDYLEDFYRVIMDGRRANRDIEGNCRQASE
ncbi:MAG: hypothetical protein L0271_01315 [Gemmatimonadetes bacterium]|nr:hypothetical protein [Gemmatimonadota bacterium]